MSDLFAVDIMGGIPSLEYAIMESIYDPPSLMVRSYAPYKRFAVQIMDDGLDTAGLSPGDYAVFREQRWPNDECQVCVIAFGDDVAIRIVEDIFNTEPILRVNSDKVPPQRRHRNDFIILGVLDGIVKSGLERIEHPPDDEFNWGC